MAMDIEAQSPGVTFSTDNDKTEESPEIIKMVMNNDNLIALNTID